MMVDLGGDNLLTGKDILVRPSSTSFVTIPRIKSTSTMILTMMSIMAAVG